MSRSMRQARGVREGDSAPSRDRWKTLRNLSFENRVWIAIVALAAVLRFWGLGDKPLHHDESLHAYYSLLFARLPASYVYDPLLHGPFQFHAEGFVLGALLVLSRLFHVASATGNPWINDTTVRLLPAATGVAIVALTYGLRRELGRVGAPAAAFLLAISPAFVYFSRFLREDIYFAGFTYATVVCAVQFFRKHTLQWFIALAVSFVLAYATKEASYFNIAVFGSFLVGLAAWDLGHSISQRLPAQFSEPVRSFFGHAAPLVLVGAIGSALALFSLHWLNQLGLYIAAHTAQADLQVEQLEYVTVVVLLAATIAVVLIVGITQLWRTYRRPRREGATGSMHEAPQGSTHLRGGLAALRTRLDAERQPFLWLLLGIPLAYWFVAIMLGWVVFVALYWVFPGGEYARTWIDGFGGVGRGIWEGLYYWVRQQEVPRWFQPWYYYLLLIPLYEQVAVVFGLAGIVMSLRRPTRFRLFLVYWLLGSLALYSWASEKVPWLALHILLPLMLLAGIALGGLIRQARALVAARRVVGSRWLIGVPPLRLTGVALSLLALMALLTATLRGMLVLSHQDAADGPHEMMVYVQTTPDVLLVMDKIAAADRALDDGTHAIRIGVGPGQEWPFRWYLRDYPNTTFNYDFTAVSEPPVDVLILPTSDEAISSSTGETYMAQHPHGYAMREYVLRSWWDEAYKPPRCVPAENRTCAPGRNYGVGIGPYLTYGSNPPPNATFQPGLAAGRLWDWLWLRKPLGNISSAYYDFDFVVREGASIQP